VSSITSPDKTADITTTEDRLARDLERLRNLPPEERAALTEQAQRLIRPGRPLPPGKTLQDVVAGKWPGDETDAEIRVALEKLS
jgi:hypothetical protein